MKRRDFLSTFTGATTGMITLAQQRVLADTQGAAATSSGAAIQIDPTPKFEISPHLYMQFMEPLGTTDPSVEAAWDYETDDWRKDFVETTRDLSPGMLRFGGLVSRYYKWHEGVGPPSQRRPYRNYVWGGKETHRVGTHEFVGFCRRVGAEPLYCVNFAGDGDKHYTNTHEGNRTGDAMEAADWVSYANDPDHAERKANGAREPLRIQYWQLGNETSYGNACFKKDEALKMTIEFAQAMRKRDRTLKLIGWGDSGWAGDLIDRAGEYLDYVGVHMMGQTPLTPNETLLRGNRYQAEPERAWDELMGLVGPRIERKLLELEETLAKHQSKHGIAITEGHLSLAPNNSNPILTEWLTGVYHARALNLYQRHGDKVKISTTADFNGTRWTTNALIHQMPRGVSYLLPAGAVMRLFNRHNGTHGLEVISKPSSLDVAASKTGGKLFLHVANMSFSGGAEATFAANGLAIAGGRVWEISCEDPRQQISPLNPGVFAPKEHVLPQAEIPRWRFPARSVSVVELECHPS